MGKVITIPYKPRKWARTFHCSKSRWKVLVLHRRCGKTVASVNHLIRAALKEPNSRWAYIAPTYRQAKAITWDYLKYYSRPIPDIKINESELKIDYPNNARIQLFGSDNPDSLRGLALWGVVFDEYSQQPGNVFTEIISPALSDHKGWAIWIGTPRGRNEFYRLYKKYKEDLQGYTLLLRASESGILPEEELVIQQQNMSEEEYNQEYECSFDASIKGAIYSSQLQQARQDHRITNVPYDQSLPVYTAWDIGVGDSTAILFFQLSRNEVRIIDCYENNGQGLPFYKKIIDNKPYVYAEHCFPHDIQNREFTSGATRLEIAKEVGFKNIRIVDKIGINDGIETGRKIFSRLYIDQEKCQQWLDAISQYQFEWDDKKGMFKKTPLHSFASHFCLVAGTKIKTKRGQISIEQVKTGDYVKTPVGYSLVQNAGKIKEVNKLINIKTEDGYELRATPEHKVFTLRGLVRADCLRYNDSIITKNYTICPQSLLYSKVKNIGFRKVITELKIGEKEYAIYTGLFGKTSLAKYLLDLKYIIKTVIRWIIESKISNVLNVVLIGLTTPKKVYGWGAKRIKNNSYQHKKKQKYGIEAKKVGNGIVNTGKKHGNTRNGLRLFAIFVGENIKRHTPPKANIATKIVKLTLEDTEKTPVYDLSVEKHHCYLANGLLVSNSDSYRYLSVVVSKLSGGYGHSRTDLHNLELLNRKKSNIYN